MLEYAELRYDSLEICVVRFEPAEEFWSQLPLKLSSVYILTSPQYCTLSYMRDRPLEDFPENWNDLDNAKSILMDGNGNARCSLD